MIGRVGLGGGRVIMEAGGRPLNPATWRTTRVVGVTYAMAGLHHGLFEVLQGSRPTPGLGIASIGPDHVRWEYGTDDAITLIPNFLATGIAAMLVSLAIIIWCLFYLRGRRGPSGFLALFVLLTLVGGGIGHIAFFTVAWAYATRMRRPLAWWRRVLSPAARPALGRLWAPALAASSLLFLLGLELSVFGYPPGVSDPELLLALIWGLLLASLATLNLAYIAAFARDLAPAPGPAGSTAG